MRKLAALGVLLAGLAVAQAPNPDQLLKRAIDAQQHGDFEAAIRQYRKVLELRPDAVEAKVNLGAALAHVGRFDEAIAMYKSALPSVPQKNAVRMNLALAYYKKGDFANAREQFETLHKAEPEEIRIAILLADTDTRLGKPAGAVALLTPLEGANSQNLDLEYTLGAALIKNGQPREGVARIEKVAEASESAEAYMLAGGTLLQLNEFEKAGRDLEPALRLNPKLPGLYTLAGKARDKNGDAKEAEAAFREALKLNPADFDANLYLGTILYRRRELAEAKTYLDNALRLDASNSMARYQAAMWKSASGQYQAAATDLEKLVRDDPNWLEPHVELAALYYRLHRAEDGARERQIVERLSAEQQKKGPGA